MALIFTTKGDIEESLLVKTTGGSETDTEIVTWEEWHLGNELVKRNVGMHLKQGLIAPVKAATF